MLQEHEIKKLLKDIYETSMELDRNKKASKSVTAKWSTWNAWARKQDWYFQWAYENGLRGSDLKGYQNYGVEIVKEEDEGLPLLRLKGLMFHDIEQGRYKLDQLLERAWKHEIPLKDISRAYGQSLDATYKIISRSAWFNKRYSGHPSQSNV